MDVDDAVAVPVVIPSGSLAWVMAGWNFPHMSTAYPSFQTVPDGRSGRTGAGDLAEAAIPAGPGAEYPENHHDAYDAVVGPGSPAPVRAATAGPGGARATFLLDEALPIPLLRVAAGAPD